MIMFITFSTVKFGSMSSTYGTCKKIRRKCDGKISVWKELDYGSMLNSEKQLMVQWFNGSHIVVHLLLRCALGVHDVYHYSMFVCFNCYTWYTWYTQMPLIYRSIDSTIPIVVCKIKL